MRRLAILLILMSLSFAATTNTTAAFEKGTESAGFEIIQSWQLLAVMALIISVILVAIAYAVGIGFEMPEIKAWAGTELVQIIANAFIILMLVVSITFIDILVVAMVTTSGLNVPDCSDPTKSCLKAVTNEYLEDYVDSATSGAKSVLANNMRAAGWANRRYGLYCVPAILPFPCLQVGFSTTVVGEYILDQDMYAIVFEYYMNLLASMESQKFFVNEISFKMGPLLLAVGIVGRSFFFTRKLGGLLIAIAVGIMFFFPGMYIFDWITLEMAMTGDKALEDENLLCPPECGKTAPLAYVEGSNFPINTTQQLYAAFSSEDAIKAKQLINGSIWTATGSNGYYDSLTIRSCYYADYADCPTICRELPYPHTIALCLNETNKTEERCAALPEPCKVKRLVSFTTKSYELPTDIGPNQYGEIFSCHAQCTDVCEGTTDLNQKCTDYCMGTGPAPCTPPAPPAGLMSAQQKFASCPSSCKVVPPLKSDCDVGDCIGSRFDCRVWKRTSTGLVWWPNPPKDVAKDKYEACHDAKDCPVSLTASESCAYVIPETGRCEDLCPDCPAYCRISGADLTILPDDCKEGGVLKASCIACPDSCWVNKSYIIGLNPPAGNCTSCPPERRIITSGLDLNYTTDGCSVDLCPKDYRAIMPRNTCEMCLFTEESFAYDPPLQTKCADYCSPSDKTPVKSTGEYTKIGGEGLVGRAEIQNVSKLMVPAYLLPLFNIVATLVFIKGLSTILGGDIEIPGISKVF